ncbi:hypothetical protein [Halobacterium bonnevillei]|uniref:Uncharacterized protein n=1 Tax=Halobacterium bonnevillei TaxID=2692200 RepID=A0A6B0SX10_9EURY|nr:hypothetical protein [Halobacterium bonnevillei]MXR21979.1 hypothetical protein [Halobacterium bonnevillei]
MDAALVLNVEDCTVVAALVRRTALAVRGSLGRRDGSVVFALATGGYLAVYLAGIGFLNANDGGTAFVVVGDPLARATDVMAPYQYEPIALLAAGPVELLFSPVNTLLGLGLGSLVGANLAVSWVAYRSPAACGLGSTAGAAAGVPALLSGFACCGPTLLIVLGLQATAGLVAAFQWLVPLSVALLVATLLWVGSRVDPAVHSQ